MALQKVRSLFILCATIHCLLLGKPDMLWINNLTSIDPEDWNTALETKNLEQDDNIYIKTHNNDSLRAAVVKKEKDIVTVLCKGTQFSGKKGDILFVKKYIEPRYKNLLIIIDQSEKDSIAMQSALIIAIHEAKVPILVSAYTLYNNLLEILHNITPTDDLNEPITQQLLATYGNVSEKFHYLTQHFKLDQWNIYTHSNSPYFLLIPHTYTKKKRSELPDEHKKISDSELLGFYLDALEKIEINDITRFTDAIHRKMYAKYQASLHAKETLFKELEPFFLKQEKQSYPSSWLLHLDGHGSSEPQIIAGLPIAEFVKLLCFFSHQQQCSLMYVSSCFSGGTNLQKAQETLDNDLIKTFGTQQGACSRTNKNPHLVVISRTIGEFLTSGADMTFENNIPTFTPWIEKFFEAAKGYASSQESMHKKLKILASKIEGPGILKAWLPRSGYTTIISSNVNQIPISYVRTSKDKTIALRSGETGLLQTNRIPVTLTIGMKAQLTPASHKAHIFVFDDVEFKDGTQLFSLFKQPDYPYTIMVFKNVTGETAQPLYPPGRFIILEVVTEKTDQLVKPLEVSYLAYDTSPKGKTVYTSGSLNFDKKKDKHTTINAKGFKDKFATFKESYIKVYGKESGEKKEISEYENSLFREIEEEIKEFND